MSSLILVDKPEGITSFKVVAILKRKLNIKRIGHTGTLDPMATGVLPLLTGRGSRLCSLMLDSHKGYRATVRLGTTTDTLDITGEVLSTKNVAITDKQLVDAINHFYGKQKQVPPMYSALKKDGVRLYDLARQGIEVERKEREIEILKLDLVERLNETDFIIDVLCTKGTYIRTLASDIGDYLGVGACLTALRRTFAGGFSVEECTTLEEIEKSEDLSFLRSAEDCVKHLKYVEITQNQATRFLNGGGLDLGRIKNFYATEDGEKLRVKHNGEFLGIGEINLAKNEISIGAIIKE